jgi:hypothetical protein
MAMAIARPMVSVASNRFAAMVLFHESASVVTAILGRFNA